jgi:hypothetical protein
MEERRKYRAYGILRHERILAASSLWQKSKIAEKRLATY